MSSHSDTLSWFWANQSLLFFLYINVVCLAEKQQISVFGLTQSGSNPRSTALKVGMLNHFTTDEVVTNNIKEWNANDYHMDSFST